ncbi:hypothetical protein THIOSC15_3020005 [uncultured Thiomicrorhabdus sp.]
MSSMVPRLMERFKNRRALPPADEFEARVSLLTPDGKVVYGPTLTKSCTKLPIIENGREIAQIGYHPLSELQEQTDIEFAESQFKLLTIGAVFITFFAVITLWPFGNDL